LIVSLKGTRYSWREPNRLPPSDELISIHQSLNVNLQRTRTTLTGTEAIDPIRMFRYGIGAGASGCAERDYGTPSRILRMGIRSPFRGVA
jgi:hypothetical protein